MAKAPKTTKTTKAPEVPASTEPTQAAAPVDKAAAKAARETAAGKDKFVRVFADGVAVKPTKDKDGTRVDQKFAPQAQEIVNILEVAGEAGLTRAELVKKMEGVVKTRQPLGRILSYYQKDLVNSGAVAIVASTAS